MGLVYPSAGNVYELVEIPITLPMGWENSLPILFTAKETVLDLENIALHCNQTYLPQRMENHL